MSSLLGSFQLSWGEIMDIKKQSLEEILAQRKSESSSNDKEDGIFYIKDNVDIKVMEHGDLYEDQNKTKVRYAVCCPECGEFVYLEDGDCETEQIGKDTSIVNGEKRTYDLTCNKCECRFEAIEVDKHVEITALIVYTPFILFFISFILLIVFSVLGISLGEVICGAVCALSLIWLVILVIICFIFG